MYVVKHIDHSIPHNCTNRVHTMLYPLLGFLADCKLPSSSDVFNGFLRIVVFECLLQTMSLYYTLSDFHQGTTRASKEGQSSVDNVLGHDMCNF